MSDTGVDITKASMERKLRAILKHGEALEGELQEIDGSTCPECGNEMDKAKVYADEVLIETGYSCPHCDQEED